MVKKKYMENVILPEFLYKYLNLQQEYREDVSKDGVNRKKNGLDALEDIILNNKIYYSKPREFNDPFEFDGVRLRLTQFEKNKVILSVTDQMIKDKSIYMNPEDMKIRIIDGNYGFSKTERRYHDDQNSILNRCGFVSLSESNDETLMWSHYSDSHRGICIRIKCIKDRFFEDDDNSGRIVDVEYNNDIDDMEYDDSLNKEAVFLRMKRKAICWSYEKEFRIFRLPSSIKSDDGFGNHAFNSELADGIYFGLKTPREHIEAICSIVSRASHKIELYKAQKMKKTLGIEFQNFNSSSN